MPPYEGLFLASPLRRWLASATDALVLLVAHLFVVTPFIYFAPDPYEAMQWLARLSPLACWAYLWSGWARGQTPGQRACKVRIIGDDGEPMTAGRALRRLVGYALVCLTIKVGLLPILRDPLRRGWHDRIGATLVVDADKPLPDGAALRAAFVQTRQIEELANSQRVPVAPDFALARRGWPLVLAAYLALSVALTWPVAPHWRTALAGDGGDGWVFVWSYWYFSHALQTGAPLTSTDLLFYPFQTPLLFHTMNWFNCALAWPLLKLFSPVETYNLLFLLTPAWCAFSAYWLACGLGKSRRAAFVVAPVFGFSPYFMAHGLGHANLFSAQFLPIFAGLFYAALITKRARYALGAGVALALAGLCDWQYLLFGSTIAVVLWASVEWHLQRAGRGFSARRLGLALGALGIGVALLSPMLVPLLRENRGASYMDKSRQAGGFGVGPTQWLRAGKLNPILSAPRAMIRSNETEIAPGWCIVALCALALVYCRQPLRPWFGLAAIAGVLACGPMLTLGGNAPLLLLALGAPGNGLSPPWHAQYLIEIASQLALGFSPFPLNLTIEMPFSWLAPHLPMLKAFRVPARLAVVVLMCGAPLAACGLCWGMQRARRAWMRPVLAVVVASALFFEYLTWPYPVSDISVPAFYRQIARDPAHYAVVDVPLATSPRAMGWQTTHGKAILLGNLARCPPAAFSLVARNPLLRALSPTDYGVPGEPTGEIPGPDFDYGPALRELQKLDVRYFVVHKKLDSTKIILLDHLHLPVAFDDADTRVYALR